MITHPYIKLVVDEEISPEHAILWRDTVISTLPSGLPAEAEITVKGNRKSTSFYKIKSNGSWCYIVPLSRDPNVNEVKTVAITWNQEYPEGDFEIDYSSTGTAATIYKEVEQLGLKEIALEAAKLNHNKWLTEMSDQGWNYGIRFDQRNKKNPNLRPWDQLSKKYHLKEIRRFENLMEILHNMQLTLVRK